MYKLQCAVQKYAWGNIGEKSEVYNLVKQEIESLANNEPYAELWMGTHVSGPSMVVTDQGHSPLAALISQKPELIGKKMLEKYGDLCYLFKVLSVRTALSIQVHPNKSQAEAFFASDPQLYKDNKAKPEMAIALTPFEVLLGFRPPQEIRAHFNSIENLVGLLPPNWRDHVKSTDVLDVQSLFSTVMRASRETVTSVLNKIVAQLPILTEKPPLECGPDFPRLLNLFATLNKQYPGDVGCLAVFFMNYMTLQPGEAVYLEPNVIHAYLCGDCVECMACSDNVIRAGLTPKYRDVDRLLDIVSYASAAPQQLFFQPTVSSVESDKISSPVERRSFEPPLEEFAVDKFTVSWFMARFLKSLLFEGEDSFAIPPCAGASIILIIQGSAKLLDEDDGKELSVTRGNVIFVGDQKKLKFAFQPHHSCPRFNLFRARPNFRNSA